jgi:uncharacterized membrane protein YraQ (UPF0718 family)
MKRRSNPFLLLLGLGVVYLVIAFILPHQARASARVSLSYLTEMALIMPPIFMLMGLLEVWIPREKIRAWLGSHSGFKGAVISVLLGTLPTGPVYVAFPLAAYLLGQGASMSNIILFLGSWAALKIPQMMMEITFLGLPFAAVRFVLTLISLVIIGQVMEILSRRFPDSKLDQASVQERKTLSSDPQ